MKTQKFLESFVHSSFSLQIMIISRIFWAILGIALALIGAPLHAEIDTAGAPSAQPATMAQNATRAMEADHRVAELPSSLSPLTTNSADVPPVIAPVEPKESTAPQTRLRFELGGYKPGIEKLRVVRREDTMGNVAGQVALSAAVSLLTGSIAFGARGFSKDQMAGEAIDELKDDPVAVNPAISDLNDALSAVASAIYRRRVAEAREAALQDGSTPEEIEAASQMPKEADTPLHPRAWQLVYENLTGSDEMFRLKFGAELGRPGFRRPPATCFHESEPIAWEQWRANHWRRLHEERAKAVAKCTETLAAVPESRW